MKVYTYRSYNKNELSNFFKQINPDFWVVSEELNVDTLQTVYLLKMYKI